MTIKSSTNSPVIIVGAPRSGTNMLRDALTTLPQMVTWPCDEINYIWRYGNASYPTDEFTSQEASEKTKKFIRGKFERLVKSNGSLRIVEKTCANSLRVSFVNQIFPDAKFIFLVRDGRDAVASAIARWKAPLDLSYIIKKARYVPIHDMWYYGSRYFLNRKYRWMSSEKRLSTWGPRFEGMDELLHQRSLEEICAIQWLKCIKKSSEDLKGIDPSNVINLKYEEFVRSPQSEFGRLLEFLSISSSFQERVKAIENVNSRSIGKWQSSLEDKEKERMMPILKSKLFELGYIGYSQKYMAA